MIFGIIIKDELLISSDIQFDCEHQGNKLNDEINDIFNNFDNEY